jgi:hypothetical protein
MHLRSTKLVKAKPRLAPARASAGEPHTSEEQEVEQRAVRTARFLLRRSVAVILDQREIYERHRKPDSRQPTFPMTAIPINTSTTDTIRRRTARGMI